MSRVSLLLFAAVCIAAPAARAGDGVAIDGPVFLVISLNGGAFSGADFQCKCKGCVSKKGFTCHDNRCGCKKPKRGMPKCCSDNCHAPSGSPIIVIPIGRFLAGYAVDDTRFSQGTETIGSLIDALNALGEELSFLNGAQYTILGAIDTSGPNTIHLLTEDEGEVDPLVQEAFFEAGPELETAVDDMLAEEVPPVMTTVELADYVQLSQDDPATGAGVQEIYDELFVEPVDSTLTYTEPSGEEMVASVDAEGSLFPHEPGDPVMDFNMSVDENGDLVMETSMPNMTIDVKPGSDTNPINVGSNGVIPIAILSTFADLDDDGLYDSGESVKFDAPAWVDPETARIRFGDNVVYAVQADVDDVNGDGVDDIILHFDTEALVAAGLDVDTMDLEMLAEGYTNESGFAVGTFSASDAVDTFYNQE